MELSHSRCTLALAALLGPASLLAQQITLTDEVFPGAFESGHGPAVLRLVDDLTGAPIAGAEVFLVDDSNTPIAGEFWSSSSATSDADGFVRVPRREGARGHWQVMKHPTLGVAMRPGYIAPIWRVGRTFDVPLEVQDWLGRPAGGALVGFCGGCGHTPDIAVAIASANGAAVLRGIDPRQGIRDLYVQHPGLHFFYDSVDWRPGEPPMVVQCAYGPAKSGRVVDHEGKPVAGACVRAGGRHRGPWGRTAADGTFTVLGAEPDETPHQVVTTDGREVYFDVDGDDPYPVTLRLPDPASNDPTEGVVEVTSKPPLQPPATRRVRLVVERPPAAGVRAWIWYPGVPSDGGEDAGHVEVPVGAPFVLTLGEDRDYVNQREYPFADGGEVPDPLVVAWIPDPRVAGRVVDAGGLPVAARVRWPDVEKGNPDVDSADGVFEVAAPGFHGWTLLEVVPADGALRPRLVWALVPRPGGRIDLGQLVVGGEPQLRVLDGDGTPLATAQVAYARPGWQDVEGFRPWPLADDGSWRGPDLREGDTIVVRRGEHAVPFRATLAGAGPWRIVPPAGRLELDVVGANGLPLAATVVFADQAEDAEGGHLALHGLPIGALRLYVSAPGHRSAIVDVDVTPVGARHVVTLPTK